MKRSTQLSKDTMIGEVLKWIVLLTITFTTTFVHAKIWTEEPSAYSIQIGTFAGATLEDFNTLKKIGYVYAEPVAGNVDRVFLSKYKDKASAEKNLKLVQSLGFPDAFVAERKLSLGTEASIVQFASMKSYEQINWADYQQIADLAVILDDSDVKLVAGPFETLAEAKSQVAAIRAMGFKDAFPKTVNSMWLHQVNDFDTGGIRFQAAVLAEAKPEVAPAVEDELLARGGEPVVMESKKLTPPKVIPAEYKVVRKKVEAPKKVSKAKRSSMLELQKLMKAEKAYSSSLDGVYGKGTKAGLEKLKNGNKQYQKYQLLAGMSAKGENTKPQMNSTELAIDKIAKNNPAAREQLSSLETPLAKAYLAYANFTSGDIAAEKTINTLMNDAVKAAYADFKGKAPFDHKATYAYVDADQLLKHISYIHQVDKTVAAPCWLSTAYPSAYAKYFAGKIPTKGCGQALDWASLNTLNAIAEDLSLREKGRMNLTTTDLENAKPLSLEEKKQVKSWHNVLWLAMDDWGKQHAFHAKFVKPLKIAYHESWVQLEDYFISQGQSQADANAMALKSLEQMVAPQLEAYLK